MFVDVGKRKIDGISPESCSTCPSSCQVKSPCSCVQALTNVISLETLEEAGPVCATKKITCMCCKKKTCMCRRTCRFLHRQPHCERAPSSWAAEVKRVIFKRHLVSSVQGRPRRKNKAETVNSIWLTRSSYLTKVYLHIILFSCPLTAL